MAEDAADENRCILATVTKLYSCFKVVVFPGEYWSTYFYLLKPPVLLFHHGPRF
jgi:hypothetical protein